MWVSSTEVALTVWIRIGATPVFWNLVLRPLRIALVPSRWSASACKSQMHRISRRYAAKAPKSSGVTYGLEDDIRFRSVLLQVHKVVKGPNSGLKSQFFKALGLLGRAKVDSDLVFGPFRVLDEMGEDSASNIT